MAENILENNNPKHTHSQEEIEQYHDTKSILKEKPSTNSDKMVVHEFVRENIQAPFDDSVDYFTFKSEKDIKYEFLRPKYFFSYEFKIKTGQKLC